MPPITTRTIGPLHFEDLEPHRFEDLVRQLLYDYRAWRQLEATGRGGGDDGFDARGWETIGGVEERADEISDDEADAVSVQVPSNVEDRQWLVQCKRERRIAPKKLNDYLNEVAKHSNLYGLVFVAACDFSKLARDLFRLRAREIGLLEAQLWGKAEIEDMLFQPKNDHLLFAYFGISLQIRKRSLKSEVRSNLAIKRKAKRLLYAGTDYLIRDPSDERYPFAKKEDRNRPFLGGRWAAFEYTGIRHDGLRFRSVRQFAYLDTDGLKWDVAEHMNDAAPRDDIWKLNYDAADRRAAMEIWQALPEEQRAWFDIWVTLPLSTIIDIDELGDEEFDRAHILVSPFSNDSDPFSDGEYIGLEPVIWREASHRACNLEHRARIFPRESAAATGFQHGRAAATRSHRLEIPD